MPLFQMSAPVFEKQFFNMREKENKNRLQKNEDYIIIIMLTPLW